MGVHTGSPQMRVEVEEPALEEAVQMETAPEEVLLPWEGEELG